MSDTSSPAVPDDQVAASLARGVLYGALGLAFHRPTAGGMGRLTSSEAARTIRDAAGTLDPSLASAAELDRFAGTSAEELDDQFQRIFGHTARGPACPFETEYGTLGPFRGPQELADIAGYYRAFGLRPASGERVDHVGCECEFLGFLSRKEAYALTKGDETMLVTTRRAYRSFLRDHLGRFGRAFAGRLAAADPDGLHGTAGGLLRALLDLEATRLRVRPGPELLELRPASDDVPMACGAAPDAGCADGCPS